MADKSAIEQATDHISDYEQVTHEMDVAMLRAVVCDLATIILRFRREYDLPVPAAVMQRMVDVLEWTAPESGENDTAA